MARYPESPGFKESDTSRQAAVKVKARADKLKPLCLAHLKTTEATSDETAAALGEHPGSIRPRISELKLKGLITYTGKRRPNASGHPAKVWTAI